MKKYSRKRILSFAGVLLFIFAVVTVLGMYLRSEMISIRQREAKNILYHYNDKIILQLQGTMNEADSLAQMALVSGCKETEWFNLASEPLLKREEVCFVGLFEGDTLVSALPEEECAELVGRDLKDFSYAYTLAKVVGELVVEGPSALEIGSEQQKVFLFLQPFLDNGAYKGEAVVALNWDYVQEKLALDSLSVQGYDYELWRVEPQKGAKEVIASTGDNVDFSEAEKITFYLPSQWNLSIQPANGWMSPVQKRGLAAVCAVLTGLLMVLAYLVYRHFDRERILKRLELMDEATGLYNQKGFTKELDRWLSGGRIPVILFYFSIEGYSQAARLIGTKEESAFLKSIPGRLDEYIRSPYLAGYLGSGNFILAVRDEMSGTEQEEFAKGLSLELLLKVRIGAEKNFLLARYQYASCQAGKGRAGIEMEALFHAYYDEIRKESPIRMMTEKCEQLIEGKDDVIFDEYTDLDMMELSKTFNRYHKQVEQLAYFDPVFNVGNRSKYFRDTDMLISYDPKRSFSLFCIDICNFSQYNELFSADVGDDILHEVLRRMSRTFGSYLYRINGDVFLGVSLSKEKTDSFAEHLHETLTRPVMAGNLSIPLQIRLVVCQYPLYGGTPGVLLERIQSAMSFSKTSGRNIVIYNTELDDMVRTEADILHRLRIAIQQRTLEVWYQPLMYLETDSYQAAEALVRLRDGKGGYFSAFQVISLAERNGMVEELGDYVLAHACSFMRDYGESLGLNRMSINLSVQQLLVGNSAEHLLQLIQASHVDPRRITLEITESVLIQSIDRAADTLERLRREGINIALDDFGVGYSSLNYLSNLPVNIVKIDRSLTQQILTNKKQYALLKSIVEMSRVNDLIVVAEGVENKEEQKLISSAGVHYIQGYYYAKPMPEEKFIKHLKER